MKAVRWNRSFKKDYNRLSRRQQQAFQKMLVLFRHQAFHPKLRRHKLKGKFKHLESIDAMFDLRVVFLEKKEEFVFYHIRNHNQLYK